MAESLLSLEREGLLVCHPVNVLIERQVISIRQYAAKRFNSADVRDEFVQDWCVQVLADCPGRCSRERFRSVSRSAIARVWISRSEKLKAFDGKRDAMHGCTDEIPESADHSRRHAEMQNVRVVRSSAERMAELQSFNEARTDRIARAWEHALSGLPSVRPSLFGSYLMDSRQKSDNVQCCWEAVAVLPTGSAWHTRERELPDAEVCPIRDSRSCRPSANTLEPSTEYQCYVAWLRLFAR